MYKLIVGKPGSSYTFSIAERIGLDKKLISWPANYLPFNHNGHFNIFFGMHLQIGL